MYVCALNCVALVCLCWYAHVRFGTPAVSLGRRETRRSCGDGGGGGRGRKVCRFNFAELGSRSLFGLCRCTCLLFILKVRKRGERMVAGSHGFSSSEGAPVLSPRLPHERHFCLAVKYIALHLLLMRFGLPVLFFFFALPLPLSPVCRKALNLSARLADFLFPQG